MGRSFLELVDSVESRDRENGANLAFPLNVSLNEDAAHDTASPGDERLFAKGNVIKLDLGVQIDGYIADTATTVDLGNNALLLDASHEALEAAIRLVRPGVTAGEIGAVVEREITRRGSGPSPTSPDTALTGTSSTGTRPFPTLPSTAVPCSKREWLLR